MFSKIQTMKLKILVLCKPCLLQFRNASSKLWSSQLLFRILVVFLSFSSLFFIWNLFISIWIYNQQAQTMEVFRKKAENYQLKFAVKIHEKYTTKSFLVKVQLSQLLFRGFYVRSFEKLFSRADFSGPNQRNFHKTFWQ